MSAIACVALAISLFGHVPATAPDTPVTVTREQISKWSPQDQRRAKACADRFGLKYRIVER